MEGGDTLPSGWLYKRLHDRQEKDLEETLPKFSDSKEDSGRFVFSNFQDFSNVDLE